MIGQLELLNQITQLMDEKKFPRFSLLVGDVGSGRKIMADVIASGLQAFKIIAPIGVDDVRQIIDTAYRVITPTLYCFFDADTMSNAAKNALLKITEEPPNNAYFLITVEDENNMPDTICSRATIFRMNPYLSSELRDFAKLYITNDRDAELLNICTTPGQIKQMLNYNVSEFHDYVKLVFDNITEVSGANALKIANKVAFKEGDTGYDLKLFWRMFIKICLDTIQDNFYTSQSLCLLYGKWAVCTSEYLRKARSKSISKLMLFDSWVMDIRGVD